MELSRAGGSLAAPVVSRSGKERRDRNSDRCLHQSLRIPTVIQLRLRANVPFPATPTCSCSAVGGLAGAGAGCHQALNSPKKCSDLFVCTLVHVESGFEKVIHTVNRLWVTSAFTTNSTHVTIRPKNAYIMSQLYCDWWRQRHKNIDLRKGYSFEDIRDAVVFPRGNTTTVAGI